MTAPNVEVWALPSTGPAVCLSDLGDYELSRVDGDVGSVSLDYPATGEGFELLHELRKPYRRLAVEIRTDGTAATARRAILTDAQGDSTKPGSTWKITGLYAGMRMAHACCLYSEDGENGDTVISGTPGVIVRTLMIRAQAEGVLLNVDFSSFSNTTDSNGQVWAKEATLTFSPGRDYLSILQELRNKLGMAEWDFHEDDTGADLYLYNPDTRGTDHSLPGQQVTLEYGRDFTDGPVTSSNRNVGTNVLGVGVNGMYVEAENAAALALLGEKIQVYADFGSVYDEATLESLTVAAAEQAGVGAHSYSHELILGEDSPRPGLDYDLTDWVLRAVNGTTERLKVSQLVYRRSGGVVTCSVTLGDLQVDQEVKTRQMLESLADGSSIVGTSTLRPETDDGKAPGGATSPTVSSTAYYDGGTPLATLAAAWPAVLVNDDGTSMDDLSGYEVQYRYQAGQALPTDWQIAGITSATSLTWGPVVQGKAVGVRVRAYDKYARNGAWSAEKLATTATDGSAPPTPSTPLVAPYLGILTVDYDGLGSSGQAMPSDFREVEIHLSTTGPTFTPDRPVGGLALSGTYVGRLTGAGTFPLAVGDYGTTYYVKLVAVDRTGNASAASAAGSTVLTRAGDGDISGLSIGKLTAGIMSALMTISGIIRTAAAGARVELDTTGLRCISSTGAVLFEFHIPTSALAIAGKLTAGLGIGLGATVVVDPASTPSVTLYPNATNQRTRILGRTTVRGDSSTAAGFEIETLNASGQNDGFNLDAWSSNLWVGFKNAAGWTSSRLIIQRVGGLIGLFTYNAQSSRVEVRADGDALLGGDNAAVGVTGAGNAYVLSSAGNTNVQAGNDLALASVNGDVILRSAAELRIRGALRHSDPFEGRGTFFVGFGDAGATTGIARSYGATMQSSRSLFATMLGAPITVYVSASSLTGFTILRESGTGGIIYFLSIGHTG